MSSRINNNNNINNMATYNLDFIRNLKSSGFDYVIPERTIYLINKISSLVGAPTYNRTPIFKKKNMNDPFKKREYNEKNIQIERKKVVDNDGFITVTKNTKQRNKKQAREIKDDEWSNIRNFETTKVQKNEEGIQKELNKIRIQLNKLTDQTLTDVKMELFDILDLIINDVNENDLTIVSNMIFDVGSSNGFYSKQYALLYKSLMEKYSIMRDVFEKHFEEIVKSLSTIQIADPDKDYEEFCSINAKNEKNKSLVKFMMHMYNEDIISFQKMNSFITTIMKLFIENVSIEGTSYICEHITELLYDVIIISGKNIVKQQDEFNHIRDFIDEWGERKTKDFVSLTNKSKFKLMDIMEFIEDELE